MFMVCTLRATGMNSKDVYYLNNEKPWVGEGSGYRHSLLTASHGGKIAAECEVLHEEAGAPREGRGHLSWCVSLIHRCPQQTSFGHKRVTYPLPNQSLAGGVGRPC